MLQGTITCLLCEIWMPFCWLWQKYVLYYTIVLPGNRQIINTFVYILFTCVEVKSKFCRDTIQNSQLHMSACSRVNGNFTFLLQKDNNSNPKARKLQRLRWIDAVWDTQPSLENVCDMLTLSTFLSVRHYLLDEGFSHLVCRSSVRSNSCEMLCWWIDRAWLTLWLWMVLLSLLPGREEQ